MAQLTREQLLASIFENSEDYAEDQDLVDLLVHEKVSQNINRTHREKLTFGDRMADKLADFAGSWKFIIGFIVILALWIAGNLCFLANPYDPYPFILLNLVLSCVAAIQAPVIMMSQNRQEEKDRLRSKNDYKVNLKSEIIIEDLHEKLDNLCQNQEAILNRLSEIESKMRQEP